MSHTRTEIIPKTGLTFFLIQNFIKKNVLTFLFMRMTNHYENTSTIILSMVQTSQMADGDIFMINLTFASDLMAFIRPRHQCIDHNEWDFR